MPPITRTKAFRTALAMLGITPIATAIFLILSPNIFQNPAAPPPPPKPLLTEFGDFQCPHCANFAFTILPTIKTTFLDPGDLAFEYRHYPFLGDTSIQAAQAAECAAEQGAFDQYHDNLYRMLLNNVQYTSHSLLQASSNSNMDTASFADCVKQQRHLDKVLEDKKLGQTLGVRGTPSLFINYQPIRWTNKEDLINQIAAQIAAHTQPTSSPPPKGDN